MAKKPEFEKPIHPLDSDSDDSATSEEIGSDDSDSDSEPEQTTQVAKKPAALASQAKKPPQQKPPSPVKVPSSSSSSSSEEDDSGSDSESESEDAPPPQSVKPLATKPMDDPSASVSGAKKSRSKPAEASTPVAAAKKETETEKNGKKSSKKKEGGAAEEEKPGGDDSKKQLFQRLWTEEDEIVILEGMLDYIANKKADPASNIAAFHEHIRGKLSADGNKTNNTQLTHKIRRLRKKFRNNAEKVKLGKNRTFSKPHELKAYELSKLVWGDSSVKENGGEHDEGAAADGSAKRDKRKRKEKTEKATNEEGESVSVPGVVKYSGCLGDRIQTMGADLFGSGNGVVGERWRKLKIEEMELHMKQMEVKRAKVVLVLNALRSVDK